MHTTYAGCVTELEELEQQVNDLRETLRARMVPVLIRRAGGLRAAARAMDEHPSNFCRLRYAKHLPTSATLRRMADACDKLATKDKRWPPK